MEKFNLSKPLPFFLIMFLLILILANFILADNESKTIPRREAEINSSIDLATIIISVIVIVIVIFLIVDYFAKTKHLERARKIAKKAKLIVNEAQQEESDELEKSKSIQIKSARLRKNLQKELQTQRIKTKKSKKKLLISEFDDSEYLKPNQKYSPVFEYKKKKVFLNLNDLGKDKKIEKRDRATKRKKSNPSIFDKLEKIKN